MAGYGCTQPPLWGLSHRACLCGSHHGCESYRELLYLRLEAMFLGIFCSTLSICTDQQLLRFGSGLFLKGRGVED